ncbi:hypothetical protein EXIGLDRAFT_730187 [Exidia glandulosa HHB12029]|uniref:Uncharacterized protein n=1 Tax=Exidia glandulosa HHB12029 TaxID=1314781 RepID=A0A165CAG5_EXIGL|nr:hypothetical protein EXIGLDRAFT_730187 [Exidia glandulosa HHB12029]
MFQSNAAAVHPVHTYLDVKDHIYRTRGLTGGTFAVSTTHPASVLLDALQGRPLYIYGELGDFERPVLQVCANDPLAPAVRLGTLDCINFQIAQTMASATPELGVLAIPGRQISLVHDDERDTTMALPPIARALNAIAKEVLAMMCPDRLVRLLLSRLVLITDHTPYRLGGPTVIVPLEARWTGTLTRGGFRVKVGKATLQPKVGEWLALSGGEALVQGVLDDGAPIAFLQLDICTSSTPVDPDTNELVRLELATLDEKETFQSVDFVGRTWDVPASNFMEHLFHLVPSTEQRAPRSVGVGGVETFVSRVVDELLVPDGSRTIGFLLFNLYTQRAILPGFLRGIDKTLFKTCSALSEATVSMYPVLIEESTHPCRPFTQVVRLWDSSSSSSMRTTADLVADRWHAAAIAQDDDATDDEDAVAEVGELENPVLFLGRRQTVAMLVSRGSEEDNESVWFGAAMFMTRTVCLDGNA